MQVKSLNRLHTAAYAYCQTQRRPGVRDLFRVSAGRRSSLCQNLRQIRHLANLSKYLDEERQPAYDKQNQSPLYVSATQNDESRPQVLWAPIGSWICTSPNIYSSPRIDSLFLRKAKQHTQSRSRVNGCVDQPSPCWCIISMYTRYTSEKANKRSGTKCLLFMTKLLQCPS